MPNTKTYTTGAPVFKDFLTLIGRLSHGELVAQIEYLKTENQILRSKLGRRVTTTPGDLRH